MNCNANDANEVSDDDEQWDDPLRKAICCSDYKMVNLLLTEANRKLLCDTRRDYLQYAYDIMIYHRKKNSLCQDEAEMIHDLVIKYFGKRCRTDGDYISDDD